MLRVLSPLLLSIASTAQFLGIASTEHSYAIVPHWPICPMVNDWLGAPCALRLMRDRDPVSLIRDTMPLLYSRRLDDLVFFRHP